MDLLWAIFVLAMVAGGAIATQAGINATLARGVGGPVHAAFVSFAIGALALAAVAIARRGAFPAPAAIGAIPWWGWIGGILGAFYVTMAVVAAPKLGAGAFIAAIIAGQLIVAVALDHFGWVGFVERAVTLPRLLGVALLAAGAALVKLG